MLRWLWMLAALPLLPLPCADAAEIVFENARVRAVLGDDAAWRSLVDKATGADYCAKSPPMAFAAGTVEETPGTAAKTRQARRASFDGGRLVIGLEGGATELTYAVRIESDWITFTLAAVAGPRPTTLTVVRLPVAPTDHVGPHVGAAWNDRTAVGLMAINLQTQVAAKKLRDRTELSATTQDSPGPRLEGSGAALVVAPPAEFRRLLQRLAAACGLPQNEADGVPSKESPLARQSYWFIGFGEADADRVIDLCRQTGFRQVLLASSAWCKSPGHYDFQTRNYPGGQESLRRTVARLHAAGIAVSLHCFASKVAKIDAYVTPVPDRRFWVDRRAALAADIGPADTNVRMSADLREWPGSPVATQKLWEGGVAKHQEVILDDEIIRYKSIGPEGRWDTFLDCTRGAWRTRAAPHKAGIDGRHYGVDGCIDGYIIDQETTLLDEAAARLAAIFNACDFDGVYFDGGEDVDRRRFTYYVSKFQAAAMSKFRKRPLVHMGTILTHGLWHSFSLSGTADTYMNTLNGHIVAGGTFETRPTVRDHIEKSVARLRGLENDWMPGELGWFGIWPKGEHTDGLQLDEMEYLMARSLAYDAPISIEASFSQMAKHPLTPGLLEIVRRYEEVRAAGAADAATRERLKAKGKDFILMPPTAENTAPEFVEASPAPSVAGGRDLRAMVGERQSGAVATLWHGVGRPGRLLIAADPKRVRATDVFGRAVFVEAVGGRAAVPFGAGRTTILFDGYSAAEVRDMLTKGVP